MKKNLLFILFGVVVFSSSVSAQTNFTAAAIDNSAEKSLSTHFKNYSLFSINTADIYKLTQQQNDNIQFNLDLPGFYKWRFSITKYDILSQDYTLTVNTPTGRVTYPKPACITFAGSLTDKSDSRVVLTIDNSVIFGRIDCDGKQYFIEPLNYFDKQAASNVFVVYNTQNVIKNPNLKCGATEVTVNAIKAPPVSSILLSGTNCVRIKLGIASDFTMFTKYGTIAAVQTRNIGVMNFVLWDYVNYQFNDNIEFKIVTQNVSTTAATDQTTPNYQGNDPSTILGNFKTWGNAGGFGVPIDLGQFWTARTFNDGSDGLAFVGAVCTTNKYHILQDWSSPGSSGFASSVTAAHEIGHNFNCVHDAASGFIMSASGNSSNTWSPLSVSTVNAYVPTLSCLNPCSADGPPITNFINSPDAVCTGNSIQFTDHSLNGPTSWSWTFGSGSPATSAVRNPLITFNTPGIQTITLTAANAAGQSTVCTKKILIASSPAVACTHPGSSTSPAGVKVFQLNTINKTSGGAAADGNKYIDNSCTNITGLTPNTSYTGSVEVGDDPSTTYNNIRVYIDYNNDGDFNDAGELVYTSGGTGWIGSVDFTFTTAANPPVNQLLRTRVIAADFNSSENPCLDPVAGQVEDYTVYFPSPTLLSLSKLDFDGHNVNSNTNILNWQTFDEKSNNYFEIERSTDGVNFSDIGIIKTSGDGDNNYIFTDQLNGLPFYKTLYYRLRIVELDGSISYSKIIAITIKDSKETGLLKIFPNPFTDDIAATINLTTPVAVQFQLIDVLGQVIYYEKRNLNAGFTTITYKGFKKLAKGYYTAKFIYNNETAVRLIQKQ